METETYLPTQEYKSAPSNLKACLAGALLFMIPFVVMLLTNPSANEQKNNGEEIVRIKKTFPEVNILAKSAYVWDVENQRGIYAVASAIESRRSSSTTMNMTGDQENESDTKSARENFIDLMNKKAKDIS